MKTKSAYSTKSSIDDAVSDIRDQLRWFEAKVLVFFASSRYGPSIGQKMQDAFKGVTVMGCTTAGEIVSGKMLKDSIVAMAIGPEVVDDVQVEVIKYLRDGVDVLPAFRAFEEHFKTPARNLDISKYVGIVLIDGLSGVEEQIMSQIGDKTDVTVIGGSAGDDLKFRATYLYCDGTAYTNAALLAMFRMRNGFEIIKTQSFNVLDKKLVVTKASKNGRAVLEFDGKHAAVAYAEALGTTVQGAPDRFMHNPVGLMVNDEPYVRSPQALFYDAMLFYCSIPEGMEVSLLEATDIVKDTGAAVDAKIKNVGEIAGIINFNCILRTLELEKSGRTDEYGQIFAGVPTIGFSTYGEEYIGHINQTSTMLVLK